MEKLQAYRLDYSKPKKRAKDSYRIRSESTGYNKWQEVKNYNPNSYDALKKYVCQIMSSLDRHLPCDSKRLSRLENICMLLDSLKDQESYETLAGIYSRHQLIDYLGYIKIQIKNFC